MALAIVTGDDGVRAMTKSRIVPKRTGAPTWRARTGTSIEPSGCWGGSPPIRGAGCAASPSPEQVAGSRHLSEKEVVPGEEPQPLPPMRDGDERREIVGTEVDVVPVRGRAGVERTGTTSRRPRLHARDAALLRDRDRRAVRPRRAARQDRQGTRSSASSCRSWPDRNHVAGGGSGPGDLRRRRLRVRAGPGCGSAPACTGPSFVGFVLAASTASSRRSETSTSPCLAAEAKAGEIAGHGSGRGGARDLGLGRRHLSLKGHEVDALVVSIDERPGVEAGLDV